MSKLKSLQQLYSNAKNSGNLTEQLDFIDELMKEDDNETISYHYHLLKDQENDRFFRYLRGDFRKRGSAGVRFLLNKLDTETDPSLKAEALFILGSIDNLESLEISKIKKTAIEFVNNTNSYKNQYYGIIVLGWVGQKEEILILERELENNRNSKLRGFAATALRQIWFKHPRLNKKILKIYANMLDTEADNEVERAIIACIQDILRKKFGIKETQNGELSGDVSLAKPKAIKAVEKSLS